MPVYLVFAAEVKALAVDTEVAWTEGECSGKEVEFPDCHTEADCLSKSDSIRAKDKGFAVVVSALCCIVGKMAEHYIGTPAVAAAVWRRC